MASEGKIVIAIFAVNVLSILGLALYGFVRAYQLTR